VTNCSLFGQDQETYFHDGELKWRFMLSNGIHLIHSCRMKTERITFRFDVLRIIYLNVSVIGCPFEGRDHVFIVLVLIVCREYLKPLDIDIEMASL
jgi:hypothetical protein